MMILFLNKNENQQRPGTEQLSDTKMYKLTICCLAERPSEARAAETHSISVRKSDEPAAIQTAADWKKIKLTLQHLIFCYL